MNSEAKNTLQEIGLQLDRNRYPRVHNGGIVKPGDADIVSYPPGEDMNNVNERPRRSATGSWQGTTGWQGSTSRSGPPGKTPPLVISSLREIYEAEIEAVRVAYPDTTIWQQEEGMWLLTDSTVIPGLGKKATFLTAIPYLEGYIQKSWGFWTTPISWQWIGPRHTNFPDGSICAFEPRDGTWTSGDSIIQLLDLYTFWALRHEHLNQLGSWPGSQSVPHPYERLTELRDDEYCGCNNATTRYSDCCKKRDMARSLINSYFDFIQFTCGNIERNPPPEICDFVKYRRNPPSILNILFQTARGP